MYNWGGADADSAAEPVKATKDHPAILMWTIGRLEEREQKRKNGGAQAEGRS